ncbi:hypothetical protein [Labrenzia sp. DG1229]|uniref:hypothetical protein n=1 Tax=Labrenzia sp. DG1229 TaxID=681847 RepID=UPI000AC3A7D5|nr:hypothetical protein [Labrenzia sp. DG1229]
MTEDERQKLMAEGWKACRRSIFAVCESITDATDATETVNEHQKGFQRGSAYTAKSIARGFLAMEPEDDNNFLAALAENT